MLSNHNGHESEANGAYITILDKKEWLCFHRSDTAESTESYSMLIWSEVDNVDIGWSLKVGRRLRW